MRPLPHTSLCAERYLRHGNADQASATRDILSVALTGSPPYDAQSTPLRREQKERAMAEKLISGDNHIDLTYLPPDLWSSEAPNKWKKLAPRVEEKDDGLHWFVDDQDRGMERDRPRVPPVSEGNVRPHRRDEGSRLRMEFPARGQAAPDHSGTSSRRSRPRQHLRRDHLRLPDDQRSDRRGAVARLGGPNLQ